MLVKTIIEENNSDSSVISINTFFKGNMIKMILSNFIILFKIFFALQKSDIIYFTPSRNLMSSFKDFIILKYGKNKKIIAHLHGSDLHEFLNQGNFYHRTLNELFIKYVDCFIILSKSHKKFALGKDFSKYRIISNPLEYTNYKPIEKSRNKFEFCTISNPIAGKGLDNILKKLNSLSIKSKFILNVVGWAEKDYVNIYGVTPELKNGCIVFHGRKDGTEKMKILSRSSFFIFLPSAKEAQPLTVLEALSNKCIVILNRTEMLTDFLTYPNVVLEENITNEDELLLLKNDFNDDNKYMRLLDRLSINTFFKKIQSTFNL
jgi:hypothetical protein